MQSRRIVIAMVEPPLPFGNAAARWFYVLVKGLVERGHYVTAFATCSKTSDIEEAKRVFPSPAYDLRCYAHPVRAGLAAKWETLRRPYSYMFSPELRRDLQAELSKDFDILHLEQLWSGWLGLGHTQRALVSVLNLHGIDMASGGPIRARVARRLALQGERVLLRRFSRIRTLTPFLTECVHKISPSATIHTVPLGMDTSLYEFVPPARRPHPPVVSLIGSFDWRPTWAAGMRLVTRLWPAIQEACPDARLQLAGRKALSLRRDLLEHQLNGVTIIENVPEILPYFRNTDVLLYPAQWASGMKVKVLEAFAWGTPVVTTSTGVEGLPARDGVHAGIAEDDLGLIERTISLLRNSATREHQCAAARELVENYCSPGCTLDALEAVYAEMLFTNPRVSRLGAVPSRTVAANKTEEQGA
ncbi:MAG TPA: glycosyltransferase family 4 protein [Candidatus Saccharimonadales bacterium]|jgi:glycosyltransferase involved in cell wall biosynthesis|nr:glycosyltransferase family 4 protein [Candidatus Saccharimonadales bacterium]